MLKVPGNPLKRFSRICFGLIMLVLCSALKADDNSGFILKGSFEDILAKQHYIGGSFTVRTFESNALVDVIYENGYHQFTGTDGHDTFIYHPFTGDTNAVKNANGLADISYGRFPTNAAFPAQLLWLVCVHDPEMVANLSSLKFPFYGSYATEQIIPQITTSGTVPDLVTSVKWYAPNYSVFGTNRYDLSFYPKGWLVAEVSVIQTAKVGKFVLPAKIVYTQYSQKFVTNSAQLKDFKRPTGPDDVLPAEVTSFSISDANTENPLSNYIPQILDVTAHAYDHRSGNNINVSSGKWWTVKAVLEAKMTTADNRRLPVLIILCLLLVLPAFLFLKGRIKRKQ